MRPFSGIMALHGCRQVRLDSSGIADYSLHRGFRNGSTIIPMKTHPKEIKYSRISISAC